MPCCHVYSHSDTFALPMTQLAFSISKRLLLQCSPGVSKLVREKLKTM